MKISLVNRLIIWAEMLKPINKLLAEDIEEARREIEDLKAEVSNLRRLNYD